MPNICYCGNKALGQYSNNYYRCGKCHTLVSKVDFSTNLYDVYDEDNDLYGSNYWQNIMHEMTDQTSLDGVIDYYLKERVIYWLKYILKYIPLGAKVAEVGCGLGQLAYAMKTIGYAQVAFELSPDICKCVKEALDINICCGEFSNTKETYDAVLAFDLFEHLIQPKEFLIEVYDNLPENGILCLQMPVYDSDLSYEEMLVQKPRFQKQLKEFEHVFLYSKEAIAVMLRDAGFSDIVFEPACFGDDYDMFLFAAKKELKGISDSEIEEKLNRVNAGRIVKALLRIYQENRQLQQKNAEIEKDSAKRLVNTEKLEKMLKDSENDRNERMIQIESLSKLLEESEKDRANRLCNMENLQKQLEESEKDRANRLCNMENLQKKLEESEKDRAEKSKNIECLNKEIRALEEKNTVKDKMLDLYLAKIEEMQRVRKFWGKRSK